MSMRTVPIFVLFCISSQRAYSQPGKEIPPIIWTGKVEGWVEVHGEPGVTPHKPISDSWKMNSTSLWIGIASYRDPLCGATIHRLFHKAAHPERFQVYVIQQVACLCRFESTLIHHLNESIVSICIYT